MTEHAFSTEIEQLSPRGAKIARVVGKIDAKMFQQQFFTQMLCHLHLPGTNSPRLESIPSSTPGSTGGPPVSCSCFSSYRWWLTLLLGMVLPPAHLAAAEVESADPGDTAWMLVATALVMLMVPGLALFYGGMVRGKNILATMMHSIAALALVGVYWIVLGYALAFGTPILGGEQSGLIGWNSDLFCLQGIAPGQLLPGGTIPIYLHAMFQGMFAILTPALISGAFAERIRFGPYCLFIVLWVTLVYCPLAHWVWALDWWQAVSAQGPGSTPVGWIGSMGALDFAGGTVVHIAAGLAGLAGALLLRKRRGYPEHPHAPSGLVFTLLGATLLWFGWFGFNAGSAIGSNSSASNAFAVTQAGAAAAGLVWLIVEWFHRGKPTALGIASGFIAGLVGVTPAAGFVYPWGGLAIGAISSLVCYVAVVLVKNALKYDDSLDAFGVHGVGGLVGSILVGVFAFEQVGGTGGLLDGNPNQVWIQTQASLIAVLYAFGVSFLLIKLVDVIWGFNATEQEEIDGLDRSEHGEVGFDFEYGEELPVRADATEPRVAKAPPDGSTRFAVSIVGAEPDEILQAWSALCQPREGGPIPNFRTVYPSFSTMQGNTFYFRDGDPYTISSALRALFEDQLAGLPITVRVEWPEKANPVGFEGSPV